MGTLAGQVAGMEEGNIISNKNKNKNKNNNNNNTSNNNNNSNSNNNNNKRKKKEDNKIWVPCVYIFWEIWPTLFDADLDFAIGFVKIIPT